MHVARQTRPTLGSSNNERVVSHRVQRSVRFRPQTVCTCAWPPKL